MRITNQMMINSTMANVQINKNQLNTMDNQLSTQKKISKPSEDPIIAIRALRLRSSLEQVTLYLDKNIPDADSWLKTTEGALDEANSVITDLYGYCTQGATDSYSSSERKTIADSLYKLKDAFYAEGDVEYAGRYVFTGFMTDTPLNYQSDEDAADVDFTITQKFTRHDLSTKTAYTNAYTNEDILGLEVHTDDTTGNTVTPNVETVNRLRIAYTSVDDAGPFALELSDGTAFDVSTVTTDVNYIPAEDEVAFNPTTGEILLGENVYKEVYLADGMSFTYKKDNFIKGDLNPTMYFDCVDNNTGINYDKVVEDIEYNINFSQKLKVNTEAVDAFNIYLGRDIDDLVTSVQNVIDIEAQLEQVEEMMVQERYADDESQEKLALIKEGLTKQFELAQEEMTRAFEAGIGQMQRYQEQVSLAKADAGNRMSRLNLTKTRLTEQKANFTDLKSQNEDIDLEEVVISYSAAELVYNASLTAASKVVQQTLLDFL
ncbi:MAG: flagellar hook-associated protein FlgL [Lachnospira sp.]|nr:flagellar hook-associated protein FlgL [Lachnospira sp.]